MYCRNCGFELSESAKFCPQCGENQGIQIQQTKSKTISATSTCGDMDHDVLVQYLYDVRTLEIAKMKLENKISEHTKRCKELGFPQIFTQPDKAPFGSLVCAIFCIALAVFLFLVSSSASSSEETSKSGLILSIIAGLFSLPFFAYYFYQKNKYDQQYIRYNNTIANDKKRVEQELEEKNTLETEIVSMQEELCDAEDLLLESYSTNLIPKQYRDIYAAFYLYDYLSTSNESLSNALLHYNLEELKVKLDEVIRQQSEILLEMAIQSAYLADIQTATQKTLQHAAATEQNTALAAQYAQIAANNAEACAWIGVAQYIKD